MNFAFKRRLRNLSWLPRRPSWNFLLGSRGERATAKYLKRCGYRVLQRNFRCTAGEIDLICRQGAFLVFVEVKTRAGDGAADIAEAVRGVQWRRIERAARYFLLRHPVANCTYRFDLVTLLWPDQGPPVIEHFEDAHRVSGG